MLVVAVAGSPNAGGRTRVAVDAVDAADAVVLDSPTHRADVSARLKEFLEATPRGAPGEDRAPLRGTAVATVMTGNVDHHVLALDKVRGTLGGRSCRTPPHWPGRTGARWSSWRRRCGRRSTCGRSRR